MKPTPKQAATPVCDKMKAAGQWNTAWDGFFELDPAAFLEQSQLVFVGRDAPALLEERLEGWPAGLHQATLYALREGISSLGEKNE